MQGVPEVAASASTDDGAMCAGSVEGHRSVSFWLDSSDVDNCSCNLSQLPAQENQSIEGVYWCGGVRSAAHCGEQ